eukprot:TRINITY_DN24749_c0_g1_i1.p1 TRINITY_DN24749_c0_g1~~TRINITY_DN24749_c0_g1_i1.p1  ORF type:complete len:374 (-),score=57.33 TRINITY_DN24749_c0_g1_i1:295-1416(-)
MSGAPKVRSMNVADTEVRPVLGPAGNKARSLVTRKPALKPLRKAEVVATEEKKDPPPVASSPPPTPPPSPGVPSIIRRQDKLCHSNLSLNASCSSDASSDSLRSRASTGRITRSNSLTRRKKYVSKMEKLAPDSASAPTAEALQGKKRCTWVTPNTDQAYAAFHDEEWGVPVHDDKKLFELLVLSGALAELTWPAILSKRHIFREVFADFDPALVSKLNEKKIIAPGSTANSLLSEPKLRAIIENARQMPKIIEEFGSFDKYCWSFVNHKPIVSRFRYSRQVPVKTPKADVISKDLVRRGFRSVGQTVIYSFMQAAGITNDHLIGCYRFGECVAAAAGDEDSGSKAKVEEKKTTEMGDLGLLANAVDDLNLSQ